MKCMSEFISSNVVNWSHGDKKVLIFLEVGVSYNSDIDLVLKVLKETAERHPKVMGRPAPEVRFRSFGDSSWNLAVLAWVADPKDHHQIRSELNIAIVRAFRENDIEIPFPQRDLHLRSSIQIPLTPSQFNLGSPVHAGESAASDLEESSSTNDHAN